jgi:hypothetical protein
MNTLENFHIYNITKAGHQMNKINIHALNPILKILIPQIIFKSPPFLSPLPCQHLLPNTLPYTTTL